jgi:hypothetical protein
MSQNNIETDAWGDDQSKVDKDEGDADMEVRTSPSELVRGGFGTPSAPKQDLLLEGIRPKVPTENYAKWQVETHERNFRSAISAWRKHATRTELTLAESRDIATLKQECERLGTLMNEVSLRFERYETWVSPSHHDTICERHDEIERENYLITKRFSELIRDVKGDIDEGSSRGSKQSKHSTSSHISNVSRRMEAEVDRATLRAKLKNMDLEEVKRLELEQKKSEYTRAKAITELSMAEAKLEVIVKGEEYEREGIAANFPPSGNEMTGTENVVRYLQSQSVPPTVDPATAEGQTTVQAELSNAIHSPSQKSPIQTTFVPKVTVVQKESPPGLPDQSRLDPHASAFQLKVEPPVPNANINSEAATFARVIADSLDLSRLPVPEPTIFTGDPMHYIDWKLSYQTLIDRRNIPLGDKIFYLKRYLGGSAKRAVEGFLLRNTEDAYTCAWNLLEERFGSPFILKEAFRNKLARWPKVDPKDPVTLRDLSDFCRSCSDAMPFVKGLNILDDCAENRKLLKKLPDWVTNRWNRVVAQTMEINGDYPSFKVFSEFVAKEAKIACNPISSPYSLKAPEGEQVKDENREVKRNKATALATGAVEKSVAEKPGPPSDKGATAEGTGRRPAPVCNLCEKDHALAACTAFHSKSMDDKRDFIQQNKLCFGCLRRGHFTRECRSRHTCEKCKKRHPTCLHEERDERLPTADDSPTDRTVSTFGVRKTGTATAMIVPVWVSSARNPKSEVLVYALLDTQSDTTFILDEIGQALEAERVPVKIKLNTMTSLNAIVQCEKLRDLQVRGYNSKERLNIGSAYSRDSIPIERSAIPTEKTAREWSHLAAIADEIPPLQNCEVGMLIGYDCPLAVAATECIIGTEGQPCGLKTILGWSIVGPGGTNAATDVTGYSHRVSVREMPAISPSDVLKVLESDFNDGSTGDKIVSQEDLQFIELMDKGIHRREDSHYEMPLPFKSCRPTLPDNKRMAFTRLNHLKRRLTRNPKYFDDYKSFMADIIKNGHAELVCDEGTDGGRWYIPHHGVYHPNRPEKIRVVFDCSAKQNGVSLNDHLLTGPDLINGLVGVLCRFRKNPVALMCDVEKMFHQFYVDERDRDYLRFLWWKDGDVSKDVSEYRMTVHLFGAASSPGCANYGLKHIAKEYQNEFPEASRFISRNFYVDDGLTSEQSTMEAIKLAQDVTDLCKTSGLHLHKFISNSKSVIESIPVSERAADLKDLDLSMEELPVGRALGVEWCVENDSFRFRVTLNNKPLTRRNILSTVASIYDPLGFLAPFILIGKKILQEVCQRGIGWDEALPNELQPRWEKGIGDFVNLEKIQISRCVKPHDFGEPTTVELHHFSDASTFGYGQCSYLRLVTGDQVHCTLVAGKARVAPTKVVTIPRLELTAAVTSVKMSVMLKEELDYEIDGEYFWTDSKVVLGYIGNEARRFHVFVANRVQRIRLNSTPEQWHYVETERNPADHASRGLTALELAQSNWFAGPQSLWERDVSFADNPAMELRVGDPEVRSSIVLSTKSAEVFPLLDRLNKFSKWSAALRAVAQLQRLARGERHRRTSTVQERKEAEHFIIGLVQQRAFEEEIEQLNAKDSLTRTSKLFTLDPFLQDGILRIGGRLTKSALSDELKHPAILPKDSHVTELIIDYCHERTQHQGRGMTQNEVRSNGYWVVGGSKVVAAHLRRCVWCRKFRRPVEEQKMADLPEDRVETSPPFAYCGIDCFGPFKVKQGRKEYKRYGLLLTCMCSRAVHIEVLDDMTTDAFINALRCFIAIRGTVRQIRCDQGSNFIGAKNEFSEALKEMDGGRLQAYLAERQCDFVMNAPHSSHAGGVWERQIRTIRNVLTSLFEQCPSRFDDASLRTFFYEAMHIVNSRPLSTENINDPTHLEPLTPNHLLTMKSSLALPPPGHFVKQDLYIRKRWRRVQYLTEQFWSRWRKEYLLNLTQRQKWHVQRRNLKVGDIVVIKDDGVARNQWPMARVTDTIASHDGLVRKVKVQTSSGTVLERPIQQLVLLLESDE